MGTTKDLQGTEGDQQFEQVIGTLLLCGVVTAASVVLLGGIVYLARHGAEAPDYHRFQGSYRSVRGIVRDVLAGRGRGWIQLGILMLVATPVARVALSLVGFLRRRDFLYTVFSFIVLCVLILSLLGRRL